jgi:hypothetical protein
MTTTNTLAYLLRASMTKKICFTTFSPENQSTVERDTVCSENLHCSLQRTASDPQVKIKHYFIIGTIE